jgi:hypothetical protein
MRGGGVGFYVKEYLNVQVLEEMSIFETKLLKHSPSKSHTLTTARYYYLVYIDLTVLFQMYRLLNKWIVFWINSQTCYH